MKYPSRVRASCVNDVREANRIELGLPSGAYVLFFVGGGGWVRVKGSGLRVKG